MRGGRRAADARRPRGARRKLRQRNGCTFECRNCGVLPLPCRPLWGGPRAQRVFGWPLRGAQRPRAARRSTGGRRKPRALPRFDVLRPAKAPAIRRAEYARRARPAPKRREGNFKTPQSGRLCALRFEYCALEHCTFALCAFERCIFARHGLGNLSRLSPPGSGTPPRAPNRSARGRVH